jgi:hypothetical protein
VKNSKGNGSRVKIERHKGKTGGLGKPDKSPLGQAIANLPRQK